MQPQRVQIMTEKPPKRQRAQIKGRLVVRKMLTCRDSLRVTTEVGEVVAYLSNE